MSRIQPRPDSRRPYAAWSAEALAIGLLQGDEEAFREIYERYWYGLFRTAYRKLGTREEAEELVQELFAGLWNKRATAQIGQLEPYLYTAVRYRVIDSIRSGQKRRQYLTASRGGRFDLDHSTEQDLEAADLSEAVAASLQRLPSQTQDIFRRSRVQHQSVPEIAEDLQVSAKTVEYHITKALKHLRLSLKDFMALALLWFVG